MQRGSSRALQADAAAGEAALIESKEAECIWFIHSIYPQYLIRRWSRACWKDGGNRCQPDGKAGEIPRGCRLGCNTGHPQKTLQILRFEVQNMAFSAKEHAGLMGVQLLKPNKNISVVFNPWHNCTESQKEDLRKDKASCAGWICLAWKRLQHHCSKGNHLNLWFCRTYKMLQSAERKEVGASLPAEVEAFAGEIAT